MSPSSRATERENKQVHVGVMYYLHTPLEAPKLNFELGVSTRQTLYSVIILVLLFYLTLVLSEVVWHLEMCKVCLAT